MQYEEKYAKNNEKSVELPDYSSDPSREKDIQRVCHAVLMHGVVSTGDYGSGAVCAFCFKECAWDAGSVGEIEHDLNCIVLVAKDLVSTR